MIDFNKLINIINKNKSFLLTTHVNPDADAIGSEIAFAHMLKLLKKNYRIVNHSATPYNLEFLDSEKEIEKFDLKKHKNIFDEVEVLVALDFNRANRMVSMEESFRKSNSFKICIDHHQEPEDFVDEQFVDANYSATGHLIFDLIRKNSIVEMNFDIAMPIYAAIMTDTGSFRFERTTSELHRVIAELMELKVDPGDVYDKIYDQSKFSKVKLLGRALESMKLTGENKISYMVLTQNDFNMFDAIESDTDGFVNFALSVEGVRIGMLFIELKNGFKVSFRSKESIPVNKLAAEFGGGGHQNAAGARFFDANLNDHINEILNKAEVYLKKGI